MTVIATLFQGSQLVDTFSTITWVDVLFVKGFSVNATLKASFLPLNNKIRFWVEETASDTFTIVNSDAIIDAASGTPSTAINAYVVPVYSKSGAVIILKINITSSDYLTFIQAAISQASRSIRNVSETLSITHLTSAASTLNGSTNREVGLSLFDGSYVSVFNKRIYMPDGYVGYYPLLNSGFNNGLWVRQTIDSSTGNIFLSVANSATGADTDFGSPVLVTQKNGSLYTYPSNAYTGLPTVKYSFSTNSYQQATNQSTSPFPYLIAVAGDGTSSFVFTVSPAYINKAAQAKAAAKFDDGAHYLGIYKSGIAPNLGLGGYISTELVLPSIMVTPTQTITGIRIISTGGLSSNDLKISQRSATTSQSTLLSGGFAVLDGDNHVYLRFGENVSNGLFTGGYGPEVEITESGTYVLHSNLGGTITIVTNRLLYNPYYTGFEQLSFNNTDSDLLSAVTPLQVINGATEYHCIYLKNRHPTTTFARVSIWSDLNCNNILSSTSNQQYMQFALKDGTIRNGDGSENVSIANANTAPTGITFAFADAESSAMVINDLLPNQCVPIWIKRVVNSSATVTKQDVLSYIRMKVMY